MSVLSNEALSNWVIQMAEYVGILNGITGYKEFSNRPLWSNYHFFKRPMLFSLMEISNHRMINSVLIFGKYFY